MKSNGLNPFREIPEHFREVRRQRHHALEVRKKFERVITAYRELVNDPRYIDVRQGLESSLGEQLHTLVTEASACGRCAPHAVRVKALNDLVARPLHQLWLDAERSRMEPEPAQTE